MTMRDLDIITIGRSSVDLYGIQVGGRLEDMRSFEKYIGGSPTNMAVGAARLGLRAGLLTKVGDEHMGRFIRERLIAEGVEVAGVLTDPLRLTALVLLGIRDDDSFPLIFYRENCADMSLSEGDVDPDFFARASTVVATGTHLSHPRTEAAVLKALRLAKEANAKTALDIDYRPNLWGVAGHGEGESRFVASESVTARLQAHLNLFDLIVGTEEEFHIAGGTTDTLSALRTVRGITKAVLVCKRGARGATAFTGSIPDIFEAAVDVAGFPVEVFNVLGAGDGFMAGLLRGWVRGEDWQTSLTWANACGAFAVSRHGCAPAYPTEPEMFRFLQRPVTKPALRSDRDLEQMHWSETRLPVAETLRVFAFDHRAQFESIPGATPERIGQFKHLCLEACLSVAAGQPGYGILCDDRLGRGALRTAMEGPLWVARPAERPGSRPLSFEDELGADLGGLSEWPERQVVKVLCHCALDDPEPLWHEQLKALRRLFEASRRNRLEFLTEIVVEDSADVARGTEEAINRVYGAGIYPDWWKLEAMPSDGDWKGISAAIETHDIRTRGILVLGRGKEQAALKDGLKLAARQRLVKGFAVGRTIFSTNACRWFAGEICDADALANMREIFKQICDVWNHSVRRQRL